MLCFWTQTRCEKTKGAPIASVQRGAGERCSHAGTSGLRAHAQGLCGNLVVVFVKNGCRMILALPATGEPPASTRKYAAARSEETRGNPSKGGGGHAGVPWGSSGIRSTADGDPRGLSRIQGEGCGRPAELIWTFG